MVFGKHRFSCAQGGIWYLISPSYCCGQNRGITDCLLWSDMRTLGHHFSWFQGEGLVALFVYACWALGLLHWAWYCWKHCSCTGVITSWHLCSPAPSPAFGPHFYTCLPTATLPIWIWDEFLIVNLGTSQMTKWGGNGLSSALKLGF